MKKFILASGSPRRRQLLSNINLENINSITDLGCGNQWAKTLIPNRIKYIPVDIHKHKEDTIVIDFNQGEYHKEYSDLALCSGIFEYIYDLESFISNITKYSNYIACSYFTKELKPNRIDKWVNCYTKEEIINFFKQNGFELEIPVINNQSESYFYFKNNRFTNFVCKKSH